MTPGRTVSFCIDGRDYLVKGDAPDQTVHVKVPSGWRLIKSGARRAIALEKAAKASTPQ